MSENIFSIDDLNKLTERYKKEGKILHLRHLSLDCLKLLNNASEVIEVNIIEDSTYSTLVNKL